MYARCTHLRIEIWGTRVLRGRGGFAWAGQIVGVRGGGGGFRPGVGRCDAEEGVGDGEVEAARAGAAGVEVEDALAVVDGGFVGVAVEDDCDAGGLGFEVQVVEGVEHVDQAAG